MMAALFASASSQYLNNASPPVTNYPFTVGMWINLAAVGAVNRALFALNNTADASTSFQLRMLSTELLNIATFVAGAGTSGSLTTALVPSTWNFVIARFISSTNRRLAALYYTGLTEHVQEATSASPTGITTATIGARTTNAGTSVFWDGSIAEYWLTNTDIQEDGGALQDSLLWQLAYGGPFSVPHIAKDIIEYRSLRKYPSSEGDEIGEVFHGAAGRQTWANTSGITIGSHPPLPYWYVKSDEIKRQLIV